MLSVKIEAGFWVKQLCRLCPFRCGPYYELLLWFIIKVYHNSTEIISEKKEFWDKIAKKNYILTNNFFL